MREPEIFDVPVRGGALTVARWGSGPVAIAVHGITANLMSWQRVADKLGDDATLIAPDLRGRGGSGALPGPFGMRAHAEDLMAVLDHLGLDRVPIVGHSMGGFVAMITATVYPERISNVLLVDGGIVNAEPPADGNVEALLDSIIGPSMTRLKMTFKDRQANLDFWRPHPSLVDDWDGYIAAYIDYDMGGAEPELRSRVSIAAVVGDARDTLADSEVATAIDRVTCPVLLLRAERGVLNATPGFYPDELVAPHVERVPLLTDELVPDSNHFTLVVGDAGSTLVADRIRKAVVS